MAKFCTKCGSATHPDFGLCPKCNADEIASMSQYPKFCSSCGGRIGQLDGICTGCGKNYAAKEEIAPQEVAAEETVEGQIPAEEITAEEPAAEEPVEEAPAQPQAVVSATVPPAVKPAPAKKEKGKVSAGKVILTVLLSILLFVFSFAAVAAFSLKQFATEDTIDAIMAEVELSDILALAGEDYEDSFYDTLGDFVQEQTGAEISKKTLDKLVKQSNLKEFLAEKMSVYLDDFLYDEKNFELTAEDVADLLSDNKEIIEEELEAEVSDDVIDAIAEWVAKEDVIDNLRPAAMKKSSPALFYSVNIGLSVISLIILGLLVLLCLLLMFRISASQAVLGSGIVFTIIGCITGAASVVAIFMPSLVTGSFGELIGIAVSLFFEANVILFVSILGVGVLELVIRAIVLQILSKKQK